MRLILLSWAVLFDSALGAKIVWKKFCWYVLLFALVYHRSRVHLQHHQNQWWWRSYPSLLGRFLHLIQEDKEIKISAPTMNVMVFVPILKAIEAIAEAAALFAIPAGSACKVHACLPKQRAARSRYPSRTILNQVCTISAEHWRLAYLPTCQQQTCQQLTNRQPTSHQPI